MLKTFEEEYPELFHDDEGIGRCEEHSLYLYDEGTCHTCKLGCIYHHKNIHKNCLDKQRVKETVVMAINQDDDKEVGIMNFILWRLGLE